MKIGLFTDSHYSDLEVSCVNRRPNLSYDKIKEAMDSFKQEKAELIICLGDLLDRCVRCEDEPDALKKIGELIRSYDIPFYCLRGNHDCDNFSKEDFYRYGGFPEPPFSVQHGKLLLIFLNANYSETGAEYRPRLVDWTDSFLPEKQVAELSEVLQTTNAENVYVFLHQRLDSCGDSNYIVKNAEEIRKILESSKKVRGVFQGHYHDGDFMEIGGIPYVTLPAMCIEEKNEYRIAELSE